jgi:hypothetical protein
MHYPSDVLAGAAFGILIGGFVPGVGERTLEERMADFVASQPAAPAATADAEGSDPAEAETGSTGSVEGSDPSGSVEGSDPALG